ncbi:MAG: allantoate amidohydrolase [Actinomycetota bacterium]|nr:allantoate amidohydrolase [Actinomycetota bacterium]
MWRDLAKIGRDPRSGGYRRPGWSAAERECEAWFADQAGNRGLHVDRDGNGNVVAWWGAPAPGGVVTGSHLDSVPDGGAFDGPLGVVSGLAAVDRMRADGVEPERPIGVAVFAEEEGSRFGMPCLGSRLMTGALDADRAAELSDATGCTLPDAMERAGFEPVLGRSDLLREPSAFVELHVEQGRGLVHAGAAVAVASAIWPHGRWRMEFAGRADHAGTTAMADRHDPMLTFAMTVLAANKQARLAADALATVGRVEVEPGGTNAIPSLVRAWLDARAPEEEVLRRLVAAIGKQAADRAARDGTSFVLEPESVTARVDFTAALRDQLVELRGGAPVLATGAGHDAGVLAAAGVPTAMLFVRNPTGVSHSPAEHAEPADCEAGVAALATALTALSTNSG